MYDVFFMQETPENMNSGVRYMEEAAEGGDRSAMIYMANSYETGHGLGTEK